MGRSRGRQTTKIHALVDVFGLVIKLSLSERQAYDGHSAIAFWDELSPKALLPADMAYDADNVRVIILKQCAWANIPARQQRRVKSAFSKHLYKKRNLVERFSNRIKHLRAITTRYEKDPDNYMAGINLASARIWIKFNESMVWALRAIIWNNPLSVLPIHALALLDPRIAC